MCPRFLFVDTNKSVHKGHHPHSHTRSTLGRNRTLTFLPHKRYVKDSCLNAILSHALTFVGGVLAKWFQGLLQDRKKESDNLKEGTLRPIRAQIHNAIPQLEQNSRVTCVDLGQWDRLVAAGSDREIPGILHMALEQLYKTHLPADYQAWIGANEEVERVMLLADANLGRSRANSNLPAPPWWKFLLAAAFDPSVIPWSDGGPGRLWNKGLDPMRFHTPPATRVELLERIWAEGQKRAPIQHYRELHAQCLAHARSCLQLLDAALEGSILTRIPKPLRKLLP
jgi:hypothetical protein